MIIGNKIVRMEVFIDGRKIYGKWYFRER